MAETWFTLKEWKARLVEFAGRRLLRNVANGETVTYDVSRSEGQVSQEGDAFNTKNMNDLEQRVANGFGNAKTAVETLSSDMGGKLPVLNYNITLSDNASVHAQKALRYLFTDAEAIKHTSFMFNIRVNNADFYSGTCYTDGGNTAWGDINKRGSEADPGSVWKWVTYNFKTGGADPVLKKLGRSGTIAGVGGYWMDPPAGQNQEWVTGCVRWNGDDLVVTVEDDYAQGHLTVGAKVGSKSRPSQWGDKTGGLITLKY